LIFFISHAIFWPKALIVCNPSPSFSVLFLLLTYALIPIAGTYNYHLAYEEEVVNGVEDVDGSRPADGHHCRAHFMLEEVPLAFPTNPAWSIKAFSSGARSGEVCG
jgi:hypothetical protein